MLKRFGDLQVGDVILGADNQEVEIVEVYDSHIPEKMYEIELENGKTVKASGNHLWYVETNIDYSYHRERRRIGKKHFGKLSKEILENLYSIAHTEDEIETGLIDVVALCEIDDNNYEAISSLERIAVSIGHVAESSRTYEDFMSGEQVDDPTMVVSYDAKRFAQQILSLTGDRRHRKTWPLIAGRVMTTDQIVEFGGTVEIPVLRDVV